MTRNKLAAGLIFWYIESMRKTTKNTSYAVIFTPAEEGGYTATVPVLPGCISEGDTFEEAQRNISEAIELYIDIVRPKTKKSKLADFVIAPVSVGA